MVHADVSGAEALLGEPPSVSAVGAELDLIQRSADFDVPERARKFLRYIVEETLAGRADRIKAYSIALEVFGRDASFDAQSDPVVRIEAGRLRRALERYYLTSGQHDEVVITIPKGGYVPLFVSRAVEEASPRPDDAPNVLVPVAWRSRLPGWTPSSWIALAGFVVVAPIAWGVLNVVAPKPAAAPTISQPDIPKLLIEPFEDLTGTASSAIIARGLTEEIIGQVAKFKDLQIIELPFASVAANAEGRLETAARYALAGSVRVAGDMLRLTARLRKLDDGSVLWAQSYDEDLAVHGLLAVQADIAREVTTALAQPYGVIFQADAALQTQSPPNDWEAYSCTLSYYTYRHNLDWDTHATVQGCLERTTKRYPTYATAWALLSIIYLDDFRFRYPKTDVVSPLAGAMDAAKRAVALDPRNARAQQALMMALYLNQEIPAALQVGAQAVEHNRNDTELLGEYGVRVALSGEWEKGRALITEALTRNPLPPSYYDVDLAVTFYMAKDYRTAETWISKTSFDGNPLYHLVAAAIYGQLGLSAESERERSWLVANASDLIANIHSEAARRLGRPEDRAHFIDGLRMAGLEIPEA